MATPETKKLYTTILEFTTTANAFVDQLLIELPAKSVCWVEIDAIARDDTGDLAWHVWKKHAALRRDAGGGAITTVGTAQTLVSQGTMTKPNILIGNDGATNVRITATSGEVRSINWVVTVRYQLRAD